MYNRSNQKPPLGTPLNAEHPLAPYLDLHLPFQEGQGSNPWDLVRSTGLTSVGAGKPAWIVGPLGGLVPRLSAATSWSIAGPGQYGSGANTEDFSLSFWINPASVSGGIYIANTGPYGGNGWALLTSNGAGTLDLRFNSTGEFTSLSTLAANTWQHWCVVRHGLGVSFYLNGKLDTLTYGSSGHPNIVDATGQSLYLNSYYGGGSGQGNLAFDNVMFFKGLALSADQVAGLHSRPWQLFARRPSLAGVAAIKPAISASPASVYANGSNQTINLTGFDVAWTPGSTTTFSLTSPPAGVSIVSQSVSDATHAVVTLATGAAGGSVGVVAGSTTATIPVLAVSFSATPTAVPTGHPGHITLVLTGSGTSWIPGTPGSPVFSIGGVGATGASIVSQSVASATSATLVISTGSGTGALTISDGTRVATIQVATAAVLVSAAASLVATGTYSIAVTGTNTVWTQEVASTLFTAGGIAGASISNIQVIDDTHATAVLSLGTSRSAGSATITDASTGAVSGALAVTAVPNGSLHAIGQCQLSHTGGSTGGFGGKTAVAVAFRFEALSVAGLNNQSGTTVVGWATGANLATYYPATSTLAIAVNGSSGGFSATVPIQTGIGYHFLLSWQVAAGPSFAGTTVSGNYNITGIASTAGLMVGDLLSGTGIPPGTVIMSIINSSSIVISNPGSASGTATIGVTRGTQTLYVNGVAFSTQAVPHPTYGYNQIWIGGNAGTGIVLDHRVSDLATWDSYAVSAADAIAVAAGTPLRASTPPSFWFPLGGGTIGAAPTLADAQLADYTGNGNSLSVASGSLAGLAYAAAIGVGSPVLLAAYASKCGKLAIFGATAATPGTSGRPPVTPITAVPGTPTIHCQFGGTGAAPAVQTGPPTWFSSTKDSPFVAYLLQCGSVTGVAIPDGGAGYTTPVVTAPGVTFGTPILRSGVTGYTIANAGAGLANSPSFNLLAPWTVPTGPSSGTQAHAVATASGGALTSIVPMAGGTPGCGSSYSASSTFTVSLGIGSGCQLSCTVVGGAITAISVASNGSNYGSAVRLNIADMGGPGSGASYTLAVSNGSIQSATKISGGSGYVNPCFTIVPTCTTTGTLTSGSATVSAVSNMTGLAAGMTVVGTGIPAGTTIASIVPAFTGTLTSGSAVVTGIASTAGLSAGMSVSGTGIPAGTTISAVNSGTQVTLSASATASGAQTITVFQLTLSANATASGTAVALSSYCLAAVIPQVSNYIAYVPVTAGGSSLTAPPTISVSDTGGTPSRAASLSCLMSGVTSSDVLTYDAPAGWITPSLIINSQPYPLGSIQAVTGHAMDNWVGRREGVSGGLSAFAQTPTLIAGANVGAQSANPGWPFFTAKNQIHHGGTWSTNGTNPGTLTTTAGNTPVSWTNPATTILNLWCDGPLGSNPIDAMGWAGRFGPWTLRYDDPNVNTPAAMALWISGGQSKSGVNLSGDGTATATATISGGVVTGITITAHGSGYQGAYAILSGGGGDSAACTLQCSGGAVTGATLLLGGRNFATAPTVTIFGTTVSGTTVTAVYDLEPGSSPTTWQVNAALNAAAPAGSGGLGHWTVSNHWLVAPDLTTRQAVASIDPSKPYATDDGVLGLLTSPSSKSVGILRYMDITGGYGGNTNFILPTDLQDPTADSWSILVDRVPHFQYARYLNTNPAKGSAGDGTYNWQASTKIYGPQAYYTGQDAPFTITANVTSGSVAIAGISGNALMTGSAVSGPGIPAGTYIAGTVGTTGATLSAAATASGTGVSLTITNPGYLALPATDNGTFVAPGTSSSCVVLELRSTTPHGLMTGQNGTIYSPAVGGASAGNTIPITNGTPYIPYPGPTSSQLWVTGPYTIVLSCYVPSNINPGTPGGGNPQLINSTSEIDLTLGGAAPAGWQIEVKVPNGGNGCVPYEYAAAMVAQLPGCTYWLNIPVAASNALIARIAQATAAHIGTTNEIWIEYYNEIWNGNSQSQPYFASVTEMLGYLPSGTTVLNYYTSDGTTPPYGNYSSSIVIAAHAQDVFIAAFQAAGGDPTKVKRLQGSWFNGPYRTQQILETAARYGVPVDHPHIGPYLVIPWDAPLVTAYSPAGSAPGAGSWPADAINDFFRHWMPYSHSNQSLLGSHAASCLNFGQPQANGSNYMSGGIANTNPKSGGGLPAANLYCCYTWSDGQGRETTIGLSRSSCGVAAGDVPSLSMPQWPSWAQQLNIYLTTGAIGTETLYMTVPRSQYGGGNTYPVGSHVLLSSGTWSNPSQTPPATNLAAANNPSSPSMVCYEGGATSGVPNNIPFATLIQHDTMWHPSARDVSWGWYATMQQGQQDLANSGVVAACYYQLYGEGYGNQIWAMAFGTAQPAGDGISHAYTGSTQVSVAANQYATVQGGYPADAHNHVGGTPGNTAPMVAGLRDWFDVSSRSLASVPTASLTAAPAVSASAASGTTTTVTVTYADAAYGVDTSTFGVGNITVSGGATVTGFTASGNSVTYTINAPADTWGDSTQGAYTIGLVGGSVKNLNGNSIATNSSFGSFLVDTIAPTATLTSVTPVRASDATNTTTTVTVTYADATSGVDTSSFGDGNITVSGGARVTGFSVSGNAVTYTVKAPSTNWGVSAQGAYTIGLVGGNVADLAGNPISANAAFGSFLVDTVPPSAVLTAAPAVGASAASGTTTTVTVTYSDTTSGIDNSTFGVGNITVSGGPTVTGFSVSGNSVTYTIRTSSTNWGAGSQGIHTIGLVGGSAKDLNGNPIVANSAFGSFLVDTIAPTATLTSASTVTDANARTTTVTITYADATSGVDTSSFGVGNITVNNGATVTGFSANGSAVTYTITAPSGTWGAGVKGTYIIGLVGGSVQDLTGNPVSTAAAFGTFLVDIASPTTTTVRKRRWFVRLGRRTTRQV